MRLLAIDPGPEQSAWVLYDTDTGQPVNWAKVPNEQVRTVIGHVGADAMAVEMIASYGMAVGAEVFETCVWIGRYLEYWWAEVEALWENRLPAVRVFRRDVKLHLCGSPRAKDSNIRQALIDRYGPGKERAIGFKASPGVLYGMKADVWAALAVACTVADTRLRAEERAA